MKQLLFIRIIQAQQPPNQQQLIQSATHIHPNAAIQASGSTSIAGGTFAGPCNDHILQVTYESCATMIETSHRELFVIAYILNVFYVFYVVRNILSLGENFRFARISVFFFFSSRFKIHSQVLSLLMR